VSEARADLNMYNQQPRSLVCVPMNGRVLEINGGLTACLRKTYSACVIIERNGNILAVSQRAHES